MRSIFSSWCSCSRKIGADFHRSVADIAFAITMTLAMRPVGAALFGWMADRYGRRTPLMIDVLLYSVVEVLSGLAPTYGWFLFLRALYGIGMGGEWGVGASLRDGSGSAEVARILPPAFCKKATRLATCSRRPRIFSCIRVRMAGDVFHRRRTGAADTLHPRESAGVRGMAAHAP